MVVEVKLLDLPYKDVYRRFICKDCGSEFSVWIGHSTHISAEKAIQFCADDCPSKHDASKYTFVNEDWKIKA
jgi:competence CoiA-like predicted nuclease